MVLRQYTSATLLSLALLSSLISPLTAQAAPLDYCKSDIARLCPGVEPGGGRIVGCLKAHKMEVSVGCATAIKKIKAEMAQ